MRFKHTNRPGFWFGLVDFCTAGLFFLFYMPLSGLQDELDYIVERRASCQGYAAGLRSVIRHAGRGYCILDYLSQ